MSAEGLKQLTMMEEVHLLTVFLADLREQGEGVENFGEAVAGW